MMPFHVGSQRIRNFHNISSGHRGTMICNVHLFQVYYQVRQVLLQSATAFFITKCDGLLLQSATAF